MDQMKRERGEPAAGALTSRDPAQRLTQAARRLLAAGPVDWSEMHPGRAYPSHTSIDAAAFRGVENGGREIFAKVYHPDATPFFDPYNSAAAARLAGRSGLGPQLIGYDAPTGVAMFDYLGEPWRVATCADLRIPERCAAIIEHRRGWSRLQFPEGAFDDIFGRARVMAALAVDAVPYQYLADLQFFALHACVKQIGEAFAAAGSDIAPILGDTVVSNLMLDDAGSVQLVDFDFAGRGDPVRDIAGLCLEACSYDGDGIETIIEMYAGAVRPDLLARVRLLMIVEDFFWAAWAMRLHGISQRKDACDFFAYAGTRLLRAGYTLAGIDLSSLTRAI